MIDILLATYNGERFLKEQIDSIFSQSLQNFHLIIRDDGSTDNTLNIIHEAIKQHPSKITLLNTSSHLGVIRSFSELLLASKAPYAMLADQDDVWMQDKVFLTYEKMYLLEKAYGNNTPILVHSDLKIVDQHLKTISPSFCRYTHLKPIEGNHLNRLLVQNEITGCTVMINRPLIETATPISDSAVMHDWWLGLTAAAFGKVGFINKPLILYRQHGSNILGSKKFGISSLRNRNQVLQKKWTQAQEFLRCYKSKLSKNQTSMLADYLAMKDSSFLKHNYLMFKHRFFKHGFLRNIYSILFKDF